MTYQFSFPSRESDGRKATWKLNDHIPIDYPGRVSRDVILLQGTSQQLFDLEITVEVQAATSTLLYAVKVTSDNSGISFNLASISESDHIMLKTFIFIRPSPRVALDQLIVRSNNSNILFKDGLNVDVAHLLTYVRHGNIQFDQDFNAAPSLHEVDLEVESGRIHGWLTYWDNVQIRSKSGLVTIYLEPELTFLSPGDVVKPISIITDSGDVHIGTTSPFRYHPKINISTHVSTCSGHIQVGALHTSYTNLSSKTGNIRAEIQANGVQTRHTKSLFFTKTNQSNITISLTKAVLGIDEHDVLPGLVSSHSAHSGSVSITYPVDWWGIADLNIEEGALAVTGDELKYLEREKGHVKLRRGINGTSRLETHVGTGSLNVRLGRWWRYGQQHVL